MTYAALCSKLDDLYASGERSQLFDLVRRLALRRLRDEDAAQDATLAVWQSLDSFKGRGAFAAWVYAIVGNHRRQVVRELIRQRHTDEITDATGSDLEAERETPLPIFPCDKAERVYTLKAQGLDLHQIAALVGMTYGSLRVACTRWRKEIQKSEARR